MVARKFPWQLIGDEGSLADFRLPPPLEELGPSSPSQDGPPTQGLGMARPPQTHLETDTLGTLDEQEWNGLGMENKIGKEEQEGPGAGQWLGCESPKMTPEESPCASTGCQLVQPHPRLVTGWLIFLRPTDEETESVRGTEP